MDLKFYTTPNPSLESGSRDADRNTVNLFADVFTSVLFAAAFCNSQNSTDQTGGPRRIG